ncbi:hypothetical protein AAU57_09305 [Nonlabens sp. YIK11]|uniref:hypothetical protein n=1 Tax=Nonlabens sp. YIK11 TaxID=1453349 RepID=UPI0006DCD10C|nr:hypothetical protein [Nonlabens sp. YIK11]KQC33488.1 hypothetical protein AAU57_09305 [Nonlabens sp. YIK11]
MDFSLSIEDNKALFLDPIVTYEKRRILQHYFENEMEITDNDRHILEKCPANEIETIALVGVLLGITTPLNVFRLRIGSVFKSDPKLAQKCQRCFSTTDVDHAESVLFHWEYEYDENIEEPVVDVYLSHFKKD